MGSSDGSRGVGPPQAVDDHPAMSEKLQMMLAALLRHLGYALGRAIDVQLLYALLRSHQSY